MDFLCSCPAQNLHETAACRSAHDGVVDNDDSLILYVANHYIELNEHKILALFLSGRNKRAADIFVLYDSVRIRNSGSLCVADCSAESAVGNTDNDISRNAAFFCKLGAHAVPRTLNRNAIDNAVGTREIHILENAGAL